MKQQMNKTNHIKFEEKDSEGLSELLRLMSQVSIYGSEEYKELEQKTTALIDKIGGVDNVLGRLAQKTRYIKQ